VKVEPTELPGVLCLAPRIFTDARGEFHESWNARSFAQATGLAVEFVQDNHSVSKRGVLRGIHYQLGRPQGKLVRVVRGRIFDVAVDLRRSSPHFGQWTGRELSAGNHLQMWIPPGFGHAFLALEEGSEVLYKATEFWFPEGDRALRWDEPQVGIRWPLERGGKPLLAQKDEMAARMADSELFA
jgi:dTDP-4-dehydrorhamnose 3,5-epimerase